MKTPFFTAEKLREVAQAIPRDVDFYGTMAAALNEILELECKRVYSPGVFGMNSKEGVCVFWRMSEGGQRRRDDTHESLLLPPWRIKDE